MVLVQGGAAYIVPTSEWLEFEDLIRAGLRPIAEDFGCHFGPTLDHRQIVQAPDDGLIDPYSDVVVLHNGSAYSVAPADVFQALLGVADHASLGEYVDVDDLVAALDAAAAVPFFVPAVTDSQRSSASQWFDRAGPSCLRRYTFSTPSEN